jgi:hypothetical protein
MQAFLDAAHILKQILPVGASIQHSNLSAVTTQLSAIKSDSQPA